MKTHYRPGDWVVICDKCGMKRYASDCALTWQNLFVCSDRCWEPRHPQDFVRAVTDDQTVPIARPDIVASMGQTTVEVTAAKHALAIDLTSISGLADKDSIGIVLDDGTVHWTYVDGTPTAASTPLGSPLPANATAGNVVYLPSINNETYITATDVVASEL